MSGRAARSPTAGSTPTPCCAAAVAAIEALPRKPDLVIATGDLTDCGLVEEYEVLRDILEPLSMPVYLVPGNHDRRAELLRRVRRRTATSTNDDGFLHYTRRWPCRCG